jgi:integrase
MTDPTTPVLTTWGEALDYTFRTRPTWRHGNGAVTSRINAGHFTRLRGRSFPIERITAPTMAQVAQELEDECKSNATINRVISAVSTVINHIAFDGLIEVAPKFRRRKEGESRKTWFAKGEVEAMAAAAVEVWDRTDIRDIVLFAAFTGMRQGEILTIKAQDIDLSANIVHVGGRPGFVTKADNYRAIPIHPRIRDILTSRMEAVGADVRIFGDEWSNKDQLLRSFAKLRKYIGKDEQYVFHSLRHSFGTWCVDAGVEVRVIMELMGHKRIDTTLRYAKVSSKARDSAILSL